MRLRGGYVTAQLDQRARRASDSLLAQIDDANHADWCPPNPHRRGPLAAAVVIVAALVATIAFVQYPGNDKADVTAAGGPVPRLVASTLPDKWTPSGAFDLPSTEVMTGGITAEVVLYADPADDALDRSLAAGVARGPGLSLPTGGEQVDVNGRVASIDDRSGALRIMWMDSPGAEVSVSAHGIDRETLLAIARSVVLRANGVEVTAPPADLTSRVRERNLAVAGEVGVVPADAKGNLVAYGTSDGSSSLTTVLFSGDSDLLLLERYFQSAAGERQTIRGKTGWVAPTPGQPTGVSVIWEESPGILGLANARGLDQDETLRLIEGLAPATDATWDALVDKGSQSLSDATSSATTSVSAGSASASHSYRDANFTVSLAQNGRPALALSSSTANFDTASTAASEAATSPTGVPDVRLVAFDHAHGVVYGKAPSLVTHVRITLDTGEVAEADVDQFPPLHVVLFAFGVESAGASGLENGAGGEVMFLDAHDVAIGRVHVSAMVPR